MAKELEHIGSVTSVGDLPQKMEETEDAKTEVEALIIERVIYLLSITGNHFEPLPYYILLFFIEWITTRDI